NLKITPSIISGNDVLSVVELSKAYPGNPLFHDISFEIKRGDRVALIGRNGVGKTTILKILTKLVPKDTGYIRFGTNVKTGYYDQEHQVLHAEKTLFDEISDAYPAMNQTRIRNTLASFLFTGDDVFKLVGDLSGGERGRMSLAKLMLSNANFLILDEPTNHLDITSREILEQALLSYEGTVLCVSHDRYFINRTANRILELYNEQLIQFAGNYDYYMEKRDEILKAVDAGEGALSGGGQDDSASGLDKVSLSGSPSGSASQLNGPWDPGRSGGNHPTSTGSSASAPASDSKRSWLENKAEQARIRKLENAIKRCEKEIEDNENRSAEIDDLLSQEEIARDPVKCRDLAEEQAELLKRNEELMEEWEKLQEEAEANT
nr:ATP-binding cassette domain-containing protein [Lachnospiraceae bacterium]